eukprot:scaffold74053_cov63-Cyclotella_meneghiniana.AAC.4
MGDDRGSVLIEPTAERIMFLLCSIVALLSPTSGTTVPLSGTQRYTAVPYERYRAVQSGTAVPLSGTQRYTAVQDTRLKKSKVGVPTNPDPPVRH